MTASLDDRILGALCLAGMGDALGAATEHETIEDIAARCGGLVTGYLAAEGVNAAGLERLAPGDVTDDASQMYHLARALVGAGGRLDTAGWLDCLRDWADTSGKAGYMGPSTRAVVEALRAGRDPFAVGAVGHPPRKPAHVGTTNGAAMRIAPCGLIHPGRPAAAVETAWLTCLPSHDTDVAIAAAAAIAAGAATALVANGVDEVVAACLAGAAEGERIGRERARRVPGAKVLARLRMALDIAASAGDDARFLADMEARVGTSLQAAESVPAAVGVFAYARGDPLRTISLAASIGNDSDTIATMAGALAGALHGIGRLPATLLDPFLALNERRYGLRALAGELAALARTFAPR